MIEELEAEAVSQLVNEEQGRARSRVTCDHKGLTIEVRARRRRDGAAMLGYCFDGVRLERAVLLMLLCPVTACERSQSVKRRWAARNPPTPALERRPRTGLKSAESRIEARLIEEALIEAAGGLYVARPACFTVVTACPMGAHRPVEMQMQGWDLFKDGKYIAGGLSPDAATRSIEPRFKTLDVAVAWANRPDHKK